MLSPALKTSKKKNSKPKTKPKLSQKPIFCTSLKNNHDNQKFYCSPITNMQSECKRHTWLLHKNYTISFVKSVCFQIVLTTCCTIHNKHPAGRISHPEGREDEARYQTASAKNKISGDSPRSITTNKIN